MGGRSGAPEPRITLTYPPRKRRQRHSSSRAAKAGILRRFRRATPLLPRAIFTLRRDFRVFADPPRRNMYSIAQTVGTNGIELR
jgi:hypothetical protein